MPAKIRVLVVDDSAFARKVLGQILRRSPRIEVVGTAQDGYDALEKIEQLEPDVLTLDLMMPELNGVDVIKALPRQHSPRVVVVTTSEAQSEMALAALEAGAVDLIRKPTALAVDQLYDVSDELLAKVQAAYEVRPAEAEPLVEPAVSRATGGSTEIIVIGASTGGPPALTQLLSVLPEDLPVPVAIVCHMPIGFTSGLATRLNGASKLTVCEASEGLTLEPGMAVIAKAGAHLVLERSSKAVAVCRLTKEPLGMHRPSVDVLFQSAARSFGSQVLACVLTGMGDDGLIGARAIRAAGGQILTEAKSTCVVHGMPRCVLEAGLSDADVPRQRLAEELVCRL